MEEQNTTTPIENFQFENRLDLNELQESVLKIKEQLISLHLL